LVVVHRPWPEQSAGHRRAARRRAVVVVFVGGGAVLTTAAAASLRAHRMPHAGPAHGATQRQTAWPSAFIAHAPPLAQAGVQSAVSHAAPP
jgi:S-formylglutathione hydrolase FrmB